METHAINENESLSYIYGAIWYGVYVIMDVMPMFQVEVQDL